MESRLGVLVSCSCSSQLVCLPFFFMACFSHSFFLGPLSASTDCGECFRRGWPSAFFMQFVYSSTGSQLSSISISGNNGTSKSLLYCIGENRSKY